MHNCVSREIGRITNTYKITFTEIPNMEQEIVLMKGNEAIAHAAVRCGCDGYFGYPITPQSEVLETLATLKPWETTGMVVLQCESEIAAVNMLYGGGGTGKRVMTSSSSIGIALMQEGISYMAGAEIPAVIVNVQRGGPGLGTIQPSQADYYQATRGGGNGDYETPVLAPASVQEMADMVEDAFQLAFKYRTPVMILSDGVIGQMMEKCILPPQKQRRTDEEVIAECPWAATGWRRGERDNRNVITSVDLDPARFEQFNFKLQRKYDEIRQNEVRYEIITAESAKMQGDISQVEADYAIVAFGSSARISQKVLQLAKQDGLNIALLRPLTLWPYPYEQVKALSERVKGILCVEINAGQMLTDVKLAVEGRVPVAHYGRLGGIIPDPGEVYEALKELCKK